VVVTHVMYKPCSLLKSLLGLTVVKTLVLQMAQLASEFESKVS